MILVKKMDKKGSSASYDPGLEGPLGHLRQPEMASGDKTGPVLMHLGFGWRRITTRGVSHLCMSR